MVVEIERRIMLKAVLEGYISLYTQILLSYNTVYKTWEIPWNTGKFTIIRLKKGLLG